MMLYCGGQGGAVGYSRGGKGDIGGSTAASRDGMQTECTLLPPGPLYKQRARKETRRRAAGKTKGRGAAAGRDDVADRARSHGQLVPAGGL